MDLEVHSQLLRYRRVRLCPFACVRLPITVLRSFVASYLSVLLRVCISICLSWCVSLCTLAFVSVYLLSLGGYYAHVFCVPSSASPCLFH